jgi:hypothetical protein
MRKIQKMRIFCNSLKQTHLTTYTTKTYINISHQNTLHERSLPAVRMSEKIAKRTQLILSCRATNHERPETNYAKRTQSILKTERGATRYHTRKNAKQTQFPTHRPTGHGPRVTGHDQICKTNPIYTQTDISACTTKTYATASPEKQGRKQYVFALL